MRMSAKVKEQERKEAIDGLRKMGVKPGTTVYTNCNRVSRSGMSRVISCYIVQKGDIRDISGWVAHAIGWPRDYKHGGVKVGGCGMDMGFHVVYTLGRVMFPKGAALSKSCPSRIAQERRAGKTRETDGGYLLKQAWL